MNERTAEAIRQIELQMEDGYIDLNDIHDAAEFELLQAAFEEYRRNHNL